mgnify:CR=1 FL=1
MMPKNSFSESLVSLLVFPIHALYRLRDLPEGDVLVSSFHLLNPLMTCTVRDVSISGGSVGCRWTLCIMDIVDWSVWIISSTGLAWYTMSSISA